MYSLVIASSFLASYAFWMYGYLTYNTCEDADSTSSSTSSSTDSSSSSTSSSSLSFLTTFFGFWEGHACGRQRSAAGSLDAKDGLWPSLEYVQWFANNGSFSSSSFSSSSSSSPSLLRQKDHDEDAGCDDATKITNYGSRVYWRDSER